MTKIIRNVQLAVIVVLGFAAFALWAGWAFRLVDDWRIPLQATGGMLAATFVASALGAIIKTYEETKTSKGE